MADVGTYEAVERVKALLYGHRIMWLIELRKMCRICSSSITRWFKYDRDKL
jgi:hypothetical protein